MTKYNKSKNGKDGHKPFCKACRAKQGKAEVEEARQRREVTKGNILVISDLQSPAHHPDAIEFLAAVKKRYNPKHVVDIGDEVDWNWISKYEKCASMMSATEEMEKSIQFLNRLYNLFPKVTVLESNHVDVRYKSAMKTAAFLPDMVKSIHEILQMPTGWVRKEYHIIGNILFKHGHMDKKSIQKVVLEDIPKQHGKNYSLVVGHHHSEMGYGGKPHWRQHECYWSCFTGCLVDKNHPFMKSYSRGYETLGCLVIIDGWPRPVPMAIDEDGRWTGELV